MGNTQSRHRYADVAHEAFLNAQDIYGDIGGPRPCGAIVAYCDDCIDSARMV